MCRDIEKKFIDVVCSKDARSVWWLAPLRKCWLSIDGTINKISVGARYNICHRHWRISAVDEFLQSMLVAAGSLYQTRLTTLRAQAVDNPDEIYLACADFVSLLCSDVSGVVMVR